MHPIRSALIPVVALAGLLAAGPAMAASLTLSTGRVDPDNDGYGSTTTANLRLGNEILDLGVAELDLELDIGRSVTSGDAPLAREYDFSSVGIGLSARTAGPFYLIGRYGIARNELDVDGGSSTSENQQSIGLGVGGSLGLLQFEATATRYLEEGDLKDITWLTAGIRF
ncbi:MAG: hypothetical protein R3225_10140 [Halofilum sp. (in: g-proteobacteria)]|nr:hypothetical protein [Halofilum sp. (in: g-proteobacteria)]